MVRGVTLETVRVLVEDPDLGLALDADRRVAAQRECIAAVLTVPRGRWSANQHADLARGGVGLLVLAGLIIRRVGHGERFGAELLGTGDVLRPWQHDGEQATMPFETEWSVLEETRMAVLNVRFAQRLAPYPEVAGELVGRALQRSRALAVNMAIVHHPKVDMRLHMLFWHLAERWGKVRRDGVCVPLRLTHNVLADLVAARRPSVSTSLSQLAHRGAIERVGDMWMLYGDPPGELTDITPLSVTA